MERNSKIYVAGHRGLVGSAILENLHAQGYGPMITRTHGELDLRDSRAVASFFGAERPDYVFLAAAKVGGIQANNTYRAEFIHDNLMIQNNVIHQSYVHGVKKLLFLGSSCIYPRETPQPIKEEYLLTGPLEQTNEPYAIAKIAGLKMCESYNRQYGTDFIAVMPTNLYGPQDNFDLETSHVLPALIRKLHLGKALEEEDWALISADLDLRPLGATSGQADRSEILASLKEQGIERRGDHGVRVTLWGSGRPLREFLWNKDLADACVFLMQRESVRGSYGPGADNLQNAHINVGTGEEISIRELALKIQAVVGFQGELAFDTSKLEGTLRKLTDVSKLRSLGWKHQMGLGQGIAQLYQWYLAPFKTDLPMVSGRSRPVEIGDHIKQKT